MSDRKIYLGMPGYGRQTADAGQSFWRACRDMSRVTNHVRCGSLLASNFNQLWCGALNTVHQGSQVDYFAMLHDDIGCEEYWLDKLIAELEDKQLDVLGVVVPIKDTRGLTSVALHRDGDEWLPLCRLSMHDVFQLPETFTGDDLGGKQILLNTGCWVCRFDMDWATRVHFEIRDRIVFNRALGRYQAQTDPEDWGFSRQLHEIGRGPTAGVKPLRIGATRKIRLLHRGEQDFQNMHPWGSRKFDCEHTDKSPLAHGFPYDITGWLHPEEGAELGRLAASKRVLEIGSYCGLSTVCIARTASHVTAVDYFDGRGTPMPRDTLEEFKASIERHGVAGKVAIRSPDEPLGEERFDLAFIDGAHDYEAVKADVAKALEVLTADGLLVLHDYRGMPMEHDGGWDPGVTQAVRDLVSDGAEIVSTTKTLAVISPAKLLELTHG